MDKRPGLVVHADETEKVNTLINHIQAYLYQKQEWNPKWENAFAPALCNRIDRNTGGIVIAAKNAETLRIINEKIKNHEVEKSYLCITVGRPKPVEGKIAGFLLKDEAKKQVAFYRRPSSRRKDRRDAVPRLWRPGARCPWWSAGCSPAGPTRSGCPWRRSAVPCWGTASTAGGL